MIKSNIGYLRSNMDEYSKNILGKFGNNNIKYDYNNQGKKFKKRRVWISLLNNL